jgi:hypothetical protein
MSAMHKQDSPAPTLEHIMSAIAGAEASRDELREMIAAAFAEARRDGVEQMRDAAADAGYAAAFGGTDVREVYSAIRAMPLPTGPRQAVRLADAEIQQAWSAAEQEEVERLKADAEAYRLIRRGQHWSVIDGIGQTLRGDDLDAALAAVKGRA